MKFQRPAKAKEAFWLMHTIVNTMTEQTNPDDLDDEELRDLMERLFFTYPSSFLDKEELMYWYQKAVNPK